MEYYTNSNHFIGQKINVGRGTTAHWCKSKPKNLIVFIHGFTGTAEGTWWDIASELRSDDDFRFTDFVFIGYDSLNSRALVSARLIGRLIQKLADDPVSVANNYLYYLTRRKNFQYLKISIICHSLGGALIRQIVLDIIKPNNIVDDRIRLNLFAPAHKGATLQTLFENLTSRGSGLGILSLLKSILFWRKPIFEDLNPSCNFIQKIEEDTLKTIGKCGEIRPLVAERVFFGQFERIVDVADFGKDPKFVPLAGRNHVDLVKTTKNLRHVVDICKQDST